MSNRRIRVLRLIGRLNVGGPAIHVTLLARRMNPAKFETLLVAGHESRGEADYLSLHGETCSNLVRVPALGREISPISDLVALRRVIELIRQFRPDIVHTHTAKAGVVGRIAARLCGVPAMVHTYHGHIFDGYFSPLKTAVFLRIERKLGRWSDRLVTVSDTLRSELVELGIGTPEQFEVVRLGFNLAPFLEVRHREGGAFRCELGVPDAALLVGIVARLVPIKAHDVLLDALARLPQVHCAIVGDGELQPNLRRQVADLGISDRVHFTGWRKDLANIYASLDALVLTSRNEGTPVAAIEAMAAGVPVVATAVGGVPDIVQDGRTGLLVSKDDAAGIAAAIETLARDKPLRCALGAQGRESVRATFDAGRLVADIEDMYLRVLDAKGWPHA